MRAGSHVCISNVVKMSSWHLRNDIPWRQERRPDEYGWIYHMNTHLHDNITTTNTAELTVCINYELEGTTVLHASREKKTNNVLVFDKVDVRWAFRTLISLASSLFYSRAHQRLQQINHRSQALVSLWAFPTAGIYSNDFVFDSPDNTINHQCLT